MSLQSMPTEEKLLIKVSAQSADKPLGAIQAVSVFCGRAWKGRHEEWAGLRL